MKRTRLALMKDKNYLLLTPNGALPVSSVNYATLFPSRDVAEHMKDKFAPSANVKKVLVEVK